MSPILRMLKTLSICHTSLGLKRRRFSLPQHFHTVASLLPRSGELSTAGRALFNAHSQELLASLQVERSQSPVGMFST